jgi:tetratricopeptide (TPR) repeat protein
MPREYQNHYAYWQALGQWEAARDNLPGALAAYRNLVGQPGGVAESVGQGFSATLVERIVALYQLGVLEEKMGEPGSARTSYRRFLDLWGDADLPVPEVAKAKARFAALEQD